MFVKLDRFTFYSDDPVILKVHVTNNSDKREHFNIYDVLYTTFQPVVLNLNGREAETIVEYRLMSRSVKEIIAQINPRIIELAPNESIVHSINLKKIYKLDVNREYRVKCFFFPDAPLPNAVQGENHLTFKIIKTITPIKKSGVEIVKRAISPDEIVLLFLDAEKKRKWSNYFKYIKIESFINAFPNFVKLYNNADSNEKLKVERNFITFLSRERSDYILDFKLLTQNIIKERNISYVEAIVKRFGPKIPFIYKYRYTLEKYRDFWLITDVEATVIKGKMP